MRVCVCKRGSGGETGGRQNRLGATGWHAVMNGLAEATSITSLNGVEGLGRLFKGGQAEVDLKRMLKWKEAEVAVTRLLPRSKATLTKLKLG